MFFSKGSREALKTIEAVMNEIESIKEELSRYKKYIETDIQSIKDDVAALRMSLEKHKEDSTADKIEKEKLERIRYQEDIEHIKEDMASLKKSLATILKWPENIKEEVKGVRDNINEARRDIVNKISYAVSRLKT